MAQDVTARSSVGYDTMAVHHPSISADEALRRLMEGNERFLAGHIRWERVTIAALAKMQSGPPGGGGGGGASTRHTSANLAATS